MGDIKQIRASKELTQAQAAAIVGISLRSFKTYENEKSKFGTVKYRYIAESLERYVPIDEDHGVLTLDGIKAACRSALKKYDVNYCILFGSYAKGKATPESDVDLLISTTVSGLRFFGIAEELRGALHKKVDLLDTKQLNNNPELLDEILKTGVRIYG